MHMQRSSRSTSYVSEQKLDARTFEYIPVLLIRGYLGEEPMILLVPKFYGELRRALYSWTWISSKKPGLSMLAKNAIEMSIRREWRELSELCRIDRTLFNSTFKCRPICT